MEDKISIIIPAYNAEKYIERCVQSILVQTHSNIEIIIINDGSVDGTLDICDFMAAQDNRIKVFSQTNSGAASARNYGLREATGEWIMFVDADDTVSNTICEDLLKAVKESCADMSYCNLINYSLAGEERFLPFTGDNRTFENSDKKELEYELVSLQSETGDVLLCLSGPVCKLIKRDKIKEVTFPEDIDLGEDVCFVLNVINLIDRIVYIDKYLYNRFVTEGSLSSVKCDHGERRIKYINWVIDKYYNSEYFKSGVITLILVNLIDEIKVYYINLSDDTYSSFKKAREYINNYVQSHNIKIRLIDIIKSSVMLKRKVLLLLYYFKFNYILFWILRIRSRGKSENISC